MNNQPNNSSPAKLIITIIVLVIVVIAAVKIFGGQDRRTTGQRIGDSVDSLSNGNSVGNSLDRAKDRTPAQKIGDDLHDEGKKLNKDFKNQ